MTIDPTQPPETSASATRAAASDVASRRQDDDPLLHSSIFGDLTPAKVRAAATPAEPVATLKLAVKGLKPIERQLLEGLVKVSQRRTPRLEILSDESAREADAVMIDARDPQAMAWARQRSWLARRAVIWIDGTEVAPGHTLVRRPVQWPILPMLLARALESGPGTSVSAISPIVAPPAPARITAAAGSAPQVLVVDDSLAVRAHLRSLLEQRAYSVTDADSVEAALHTLTQRKFDCVLMDVMMPDVDGYEGCHQIKARLRGADSVPVVMLTSKGSPFDRIRGKMAGCDAYLTKPVDSQHLSEVLAQQVKVVPVRRVNPAGESARATGPTPLSTRFVPTRPV
jgi:two-component system cell cycle response regulator